MDNNISSYIASLDDIKVSSDFSVQNALKKLVTENNRNSSKNLKDFLISEKSLSMSDVSKNFPDLLKNSMIINNQVANKAISLPEQKVITTSNYNKIIAKDTFTDIKNEVLKGSKDILSDLSELSMVKPISEIKDTLENIKKSELEKRNFLSGMFFGLTNLKKSSKEILDDTQSTEKNVSIEPIINEPTTNYLKGIKSTHGVDMGTEAVAWINNIKNLENSDNNGFRFNFTVYREKTSVSLKPKYGNLDPEALSRVSLTFISKMNSVNRNKKTGYGYANDSYFQKKAISDNDAKNLALKVSLSSSVSSLNKNRHKNNPFVRDMLLAGPDLYSNMFDVYLRFNNKPTSTDITYPKEGDILEPTSYMFFTPVLNANLDGKIDNTYTHVFESTFRDVYSMSVRTASVDVPMINRTISDLPFLNTKVTRPSGMTEYDLQGTLTVDCDANTYVNDMFLALAGLQRIGTYKDANGKQSYINKNMYNHVSQFPFMAPAKLGFQMSSVDLIVSSHSLCAYHDKTVNPGGGGFFSNILYVFKDVRFLGGSDIKFSTESSESQAVEAGFIARRVETYYKPDNMSFKDVQGITKSKLFNSRNLNGTIYDETTIKEPTEQL